MEIGILGPLEVRGEGRSVQITGSRLRALVTRLAADAPSVVSTDALLDAIWPDGSPADPLNALQSLVSRVRRAVADPRLLRQVAGGYQLAVDREVVDAALFADLIAAGRRELRDGTPQMARDTLVKALALWRGDPLADAGDAAYATPLRVKLRELRVDAQTDRIEADLVLGRTAEVVGELEVLAAGNPMRERIAGQLMRALAASGRTAESLGVYDALRGRLADELGVDPGPELQELQLAVLRGEIPTAAPPVARRPRSNLRAALTSFIGRDGEVARVSALLEGGRLVTIVGPGGAGKTRLASEVAAAWIPRRADGVWLVELAPVTDEKAIAQAVLGALGLMDARAVERRVERHARDSTQHVLEVLAQADCLLLIDNCEHLIGGAAALVDELLARCPDLRIITTSREPLGIVGEALCVLPPLGLPASGASARDAALQPAVRLLVERARAVRADFEIDEHTVGSAVEIVRRLDGLPLAIELAAARLRVLPIDEIAARLSDRFRLLTGGSRTAMPRHRTLRAVVEWSWDLLADDERLLAERLAVFPGGATPESAAAVCADDRLPAFDIGDLLLALVDKSLLVPVDGHALRYRMLETIREYGVERMAERSEARAARTAHARHFGSLARTLDPVLRTGDQMRALNVLNAERDNVLAALRFLGESEDPADRLAALDIALALGWYWAMIGANAESARWVGFALAATEGIEHPDRLWAEAVAAISLVTTGTITGPGWEESRTALRDLAGRLADAPDPRFPALIILAPMLSFFAGDTAAAETMMVRTLQSDDGWIRAAARLGRASVAENNGDVDGMRRDIDAAYEDFSLIGDKWGLSGVLAARGYLRTLDGDLAGAVQDCEGAIRYAAELGSIDDRTLLLLRIAGLRLRLGDIAGARRTVEEVRSEIHDHGEGFHGLERGLFADAILLSIDLHEGNTSTTAATAADIRRQVHARPPDALQGHATAIVGSVVAMAAIAAGDIDTARADLALAYPAGVATSDMPIVASVGIAVASLALAMDRPADAAAIMGASTRLRGSEDPTDPIIARLTRRVSATEPDFDEIYTTGRFLSRAAAIDRLDPGLLVDRRPAAVGAPES